MRIVDYRFTVSREPLLRPFAFKGGSFTEKWITVTSLRGDDGSSVTAIGALDPLWSDARVFGDHSEVGGNIVMAAVAEQAARAAVGRTVGRADRTPLDVQDAIFDEVTEYAVAITGRYDVRRTFVLNALTSLDLALWKLHAHALGSTTFDQMLPGEYAHALPARHDEVAHVPLVTYGIGVDELSAMAARGTFVFKIKLGQEGSQAEMLDKDAQRVSDIHRALGSPSGGGAGPGSVAYYLDANGRYESRERVQRLLEQIDREGALDQVVLLEEPFPREVQAEASDLPVRLAGDESVESEADVERLADQGFRAIAIKPAGKSLSASLRAARAARRRGMDTFVADSACVPQLVDWNLNVAARLPAVSGLQWPLLESNGADHYRNWQAMLDAHPCAGSSWLVPEQGSYRLDREFYLGAGCVLGSAGSYEELLPPWPESGHG
jgi:L-alanine-DL-glutamate epimerase-like enolase superfamily enzyme